MLRPDAAGFQIATLLSLFAAFLYACAMVLTWAKCRDADPFALALALNVAFIMGGMLLGLFFGERPDLLTLAGIVVIAGAGILALPRPEKAAKP